VGSSLPGACTSLYSTRHERDERTKGEEGSKEKMSTVLSKKEPNSVARSRMTTLDGRPETIGVEETVMSPSAEAQNDALTSSVTTREFVPETIMIFNPFTTPVGEESPPIITNEEMSPTVTKEGDS